MTEAKSGRLFVLCLLLLAGIWPRALAAEETALTSVPEIRLEALQGRIELAREAELPEEMAAELIELYGEALSHVQTAREWERKADEFEQARRAAPEMLQAIRQELEREPTEVRVEVPDLPVAELEVRLADVEAELTAARQRVADLEAEHRMRAERRAEVPGLTAEARQLLEEIDTELAAELPPEPTPLEVARRTLLLARRRAREGELRAYEQEILSYEARGELLTARRTRAARAATRAERRREQWQEVVRDRRRLEVEEAARRAVREAAEAHPALREIAEQNSRLARERAETVIPGLEESASELGEIEQKLSALRVDLDRTREKLDRIGLTEALGVLLRRKRLELPDLRQYQRLIQERQPEIGRVQWRLFELDEQRAALADLEARVAETIQTLDLPLREGEREHLEEAVRDLMLTRLNLVGALLGDYDAYFDRLVELDTRTRELTALVREYRAFIEGNVLWFRSSDRLGPNDAGRTLAALHHLLAPERWLAVGRRVVRDAPQRPLLYALVALVFGALLVLQPRLRHVLERSGKLAASIRTDRMLHTLAAIGATLLRASEWPWLLLAGGGLLRTAVGAGGFTISVGAGLQAAGLVWFTAGILREACREDGLADVHFRFRLRPLKVLRRNLWWLACIAVPAAFVVVFFESMGEEVHRDSLGRIVLIVGLVAGSVFLHLILRRRGGILQEVMEREEGGWLERLSSVWDGLVAAVPLGLAVAAGAGYYYTAVVLSVRLAVTLWLALGLLLVYEVLQRGLFVARRKMALKVARKRREEVVEGEKDKAEPGEPEVDIQAVSAQSRQLLRSVVGFALVLMLWFVWNDVVPALGILGTVIVHEGLAITLADVGMALLIFVVMVLAAKNIPALLEITILQYLPLEPAVRFAISRVCRYAITVVGLVLAFNAIGIGWDKVQWLAAAMTVGLGFGLQEIFANFVSGLIILFERPMRVGDTVTVGDVTGTVTKIRIRATTILDRDRKELVVPNREFITDRLVNWSLSDNIIRVIIPVGIAYGSDTEKAHRLLLQVARQDPLVLDEPEPLAFFLDFGDSSLGFELRVFVPGIQAWSPVRHSLHMAIDRAFREAGIEISFPQRDIHIRSIKATLPIEGHEPAARPGSTAPAE